MEGNMIIEDIKIALRIKNIAYDLEIQGLIDACKIDLALAGIVTINDTDALIKRAIITYCKANFGWNNPEAERLQQSYTMLKMSMALAGDYNALV
jgi:hypothetical protein